MSDIRRLWNYGAPSIVVAAAVAGAATLIAPGMTGWVGFGVSATILPLLAVSVLSAPLQSAGEELIFRSAVMPVVASSVRAVRPALGLGTAAMAVISHGIEAPVASPRSWAPSPPSPVRVVIAAPNWSDRKNPCPVTRLYVKGEGTQHPRQACPESTH